MLILSKLPGFCDFRFSEPRWLFSHTKAIMSLFSGSIFRLATTSTRFVRTFSAASRAFASYNDRAPSPVSNRLFISLNFDTTESDLKAACEKYGEILSTKVIKDRETQRSRG